MKQTDNALCTKCAELFRDAGYTVRGSTTFENAKCVLCGKTRPVHGILIGNEVDDND